jgi:hypothetical protein
VRDDQALRLYIKSEQALRLSIKNYYSGRVSVYNPAERRTEETSINSNVPYEGCYGLVHKFSKMTELSYNK